MPGNPVLPAGPCPPTRLHDTRTHPQRLTPQTFSRTRLLQITEQPGHWHRHRRPSPYPQLLRAVLSFRLKDRRAGPIEIASDLVSRGTADSALRRNIRATLSDTATDCTTIDLQPDGILETSTRYGLAEDGHAHLGARLASVDAMVEIHTHHHHAGH